MATLTPHQRLASRALGLLLDEATQSRLKLHGFVPDGFGCVVRDGGAPLSHARALSICVDEAAEPVGVGGSHTQQCGDHHQEERGEQGDAVHEPTVERAYLLTRLAEIDSSADGSVRSTLDRVTVELGAATSALIADVAADGREDEHLRHAAALEKIAGIALRGAGAALRTAEEGR